MVPHEALGSPIKPQRSRVGSGYLLSLPLRDDLFTPDENNKFYKLLEKVADPRNPRVLFSRGSMEGSWPKMNFYKAG
jgi:hypothetical protein